MIWLQNCKMDTKNNAMHVNPKHKLCMKKKFGQILKNWKIFSFDRLSIDQIPIESGRFKPKILIAISIGQKTSSIDWKSVKHNFWKNRVILCRNFSKHWILWIKCMSIRWNAFQKHLFCVFPILRFSINSPYILKHQTCFA